MSALPFAFTATPEDPVKCNHCLIVKDHGDMLELKFIGCWDTVTICAACVEDFHTALTELSYRQHPELLPPEARDV
jgi:hypothetical protein